MRRRRTTLILITLIFHFHHMTHLQREAVKYTSGTFFWGVFSFSFSQQVWVNRSVLQWLVERTKNLWNQSERCTRSNSHSSLGGEKKRSNVSNRDNLISHGSSLLLRCRRRSAWFLWHMFLFVKATVDVSELIMQSCCVVNYVLQRKYLCGQKFLQPRRSGGKPIRLDDNVYNISALIFNLQPVQIWAAVSLVLEIMVITGSFQAKPISQWIHGFINPSFMLLINIPALDRVYLFFNWFVF